MRIGTSYQQHDIAGSYDAIVIGSGIGGLAAAALLARLDGKRVLVLERHYTAGGFTHSFHRPNYEWDVGVHYIGGVSEPSAPMRPLFDAITNGQLEWADMGEVYDRVIIGDDIYDFVKGTENFRERMHGYFPDERTAIDRYIDRTKSTVRKSGLYFAEKTLPDALSRWIGAAMRWPLLREARKTTRQVLEELTRDPRLIGVLTAQYGDYGLPPSQSTFFIHALIVNHYFEGAAYPVGGASRIAATIVPVIERAGGAVFTGAEVDQIVVENGRAVGVRLIDGNELRASLVISDAGIANTYLRLVPEKVRTELGLDRVVARHKPSIAHLSLYLGLDSSAEELRLSKTNLWIYPHDDHDRNVERFVADPDAPLPVAYVSFPSAKDPDFARRHPGRATIEVITLAPYDWFRRWEDTRWKRRGSEYDDLKSRLSERLQKALTDHCPQVRGHIDHCELSTPLSTREFTAHPHGEIYGLAATPDRFEDRALRPRTPMKGLFLTGADVAALGVGGAMAGGMLCASAVLGHDIRGAIAKLTPDTPSTSDERVA